jgi:hypothetical protein
VDDKRFEQIAIIRDEMLADPNVPGLIVWQAAKLASEDKYLYELLLDWMKEPEGEAKNMMREEVINYTDEILRKAKINGN